MPRIAYITKSFKPETLDLIEKANEIIDDYTSQGLSLTLRQLYYQFVARDYIPNTEQSYSRVGSIVSDARRAGKIDWHSIEDRTRDLRGLPTYSSPEEIIRENVGRFNMDIWRTQPYNVEVWIEKDALTGVIRRACNQARVNFFSCRGYPSDSEVWAASQRIIQHRSEGRKTVILHLGDHDPSGIDMTRDIIDRLDLFLKREPWVQVLRIALNMDQIQQYKPPPNPAKVSDSRSPKYIAEHGRMSWELDALEPTVLRQLVTDNVRQFIDQGKWDTAIEEEVRSRDQLMDVAEQWDTVIDLIG